jgi:hypothetical protein
MLLNAAANSRSTDLFPISLQANRLRNITLWLCAACCVLPCLVEAVQIGDILSTSKLGEPLRVEVAITTAANEQIDDSCISLVAPDTRADDASNYLRDTKLSVQNIAGQQRILLNARKPFNDVFGKFKLQIKCRDQGSIAKTFTILPDLADSVPLPEQVASVVEPAVAPQAKVETPPVKQAPQANAAIEAPVVAQPAIAKSPTHHSTRAKPASPDVSQPRVARRTHSNNLGSFQLKISGEPLDASRIGKISPEERTFLLGSQKLLDSDDQMASILTLQNQVKQLQDDIGDMRAKLAQLGGAPAHIKASNDVAANAPIEAVTELAASAPIAAGASVAVAASQPVAVQKPVATKPLDWRTWAWQLGLLALAILGVTWGMRRYASKKSAAAQMQLRPQIMPAQANETAAPLRVIESISPVNTTPTSANKNTTNKPDPTIRTAIFNAHEAASSPESALIEEANLYVAFNHPLRATKILQELVAEHPRMVEAWLLLFGILSSLSMESAFEENARTFLRHNPDDANAWETIQVLGRTLNINHPLYRTSSPMLPEEVLERRPPLGDALIDLDIVLPENMHYCLADFNKENHGRFGAYLVTQKVITHAQLTQALIHQDTLANQSEKPTATIDITSPLAFEFHAPESKSAS